MNKSTAHDDLAAVDRILHAADRTLHIPPLILVTWGLCAAIINGVHQGRALGWLAGLVVPGIVLWRRRADV